MDRNMFVQLKDEREMYLVLPHLWPLLVGDATFKRRQIALAVTMQGVPFLWVVRCPIDDDTEPDQWMVKSLEAMRLSLTKWVRIYWDDIGRRHKLQESDCPDEPEFPPLASFRDVLALGFKDRVIDSTDHPVFCRLKGKKTPKGRAK
jgi:hypothetical protein